MTEPVGFDIFLPLVKVDIQQRMVYGRATQEIPDHVREVMDYDASLPNFQKWSDAAKSRSKGKSVGNVREMHEAIAAGKLTDIQFQNADRAIDVAAYVSNDSSWQKVLDGTLTGFSVGGSYGKRWPDPSNPSLMRYEAKPAEISLVDSPAVPTAVFTMIKMDGSSEMHKLGEPLPDGIIGSDPFAATDSDEPINAAAALPDSGIPGVQPIVNGEVVKQIPVIAGKLVSPDVIDANRAVLETEQPRSEPVAKAEQPEWSADFVAAVNKLADLNKLATENQVKAESLLKAVGARVGIARREGEPVACQKDASPDPNDHADPANWAWPYDTRERALSAIARFNGGISKGKYTGQEWNILGRRIANRAGALFSAKCRYDPIKKTITGIEDKRMLPQLDLTKVEVGPLISQMQQALNVAADQVGKDPQAAKDMLMQLIGQLDSAADVSTVDTGTQSPSGPTGSQQGYTDAALKVATGTTMTTPTGTGTATTGAATTGTTAATTEKTTATTPGATTAPGTSPSDSSDMTSLKSDFAEMKNMFGKLLDALSGKPVDVPAPVAKAVQPDPAAPAGDIAGAQLMKAEQPAVDPVLQALISGDPMALRKAATLAGVDGRPDVRAVQAVMTQAAEGLLGDMFKRKMIAEGLDNLYDPTAAQ